MTIFVKNSEFHLSKSPLLAIWLFILVTFPIFSVQAQSYSAESFPKDFKYQNKPIDSLCIAKISSNAMASASAVNIDDCSKHTDYQITKVNEDLLRKGFNGYDYSYKLPNQTVLQGSCYYKYVGKAKDNHVIYAIENDANNGFKTELLVVERMGNKLRLIQKLASGNRCDSGIDPNIQMKDKVVTYKSSLTPYGMIASSGIMPENIEASDDLANCTTCCVGEATFQYNFSQENPSPVLISLTLAKEAGQDEVFSQGKLQPCFNQVLREFMGKTKNTKLSGDQLKSLAEKFNTTCVK